MLRPDVNPFYRRTSDINLSSNFGMSRWLFSDLAAEVLRGLHPGTWEANPEEQAQCLAAAQTPLGRDALACPEHRLPYYVYYLNLDWGDPYENKYPIVVE